MLRNVIHSLLRRSGARGSTDIAYRYFAGHARHKVGHTQNINTNG